MTNATMKSKLKKYSTSTMSGFTMIEFMLALLITSIVVAGMSQYFISLKENTNQQDNILELNENLRIAMTHISEDLRNSDFLVPPDNELELWIDWTDIKYTQNPMIIEGANAATPDTLYVAYASDGPVARLKSDALPGNLIQVSSIADLNTTDHSVININQKEFVKISAISGSTLTINAIRNATVEPTLSSHLATSPVFVTEVKKYMVDTTTNRLQVVIYENNTSVIQDLVDGISNMKIQQAVAGAAGSDRNLLITLTGVSADKDPDTGAILERSITSEITTLN